VRSDRALGARLLLGAADDAAALQPAEVALILWAAGRLRLEAAGAAALERGLARCAREACATWGALDSVRALEGLSLLAQLQVPPPRLLTHTPVAPGAHVPTARIA